MNEYKNINNLIFDIGGVLLGYRWEDMFKDHGVDSDTANAIGRGIFDTPEWGRFDSGLITSAEVLDAFCKKNPHLEDDARWFFKNAVLMRVVRPAVYEELKKLKAAGFKLYVLSNYSKELSAVHIGDLGVLELMDGIVFSYAVHMLKPEPGIYRALIEKYGLIPSESIFFDDRLENVEAAVKLGINGFHVEGQSEELLLDCLHNFR